MAIETAGVGAKYSRVAIAIVLAAAAITAGIIASPTLQPTRTMTFTETTTKTTTTDLTKTILAPLGRCEAVTNYTGLDSILDNSITPSYHINGSFAVLSMPTTAVGELCVTYYDNNKTSSQTIDLTKGGVSIGNYVIHNGAMTFNQSSHVSVIPTQSNITIGGSAPSHLTVAFVIVTDGSKGFRFLNIGYLGPVFCAVEFPFAVGYTFTQANKTGPYFSNPSPASSCGIMLKEVVYASLYGASGIQMTYVICAGVICDLKD